MRRFQGAYPAALEATPPERFERIQVLFRVLLLGAIGILHQTVGGLFCALYFIVPIAAALAVRRNQGAGFRADDRRVLLSVLEWVIAFTAYLLFVTDRFPLGESQRATRLVIFASGTPSVKSALARLFRTLPHAIVLSLLGVAAALVAFASAVTVLVGERCPEVLQTFQRDVVAWVARVFAYHASLVDEYPPFALGTGDRAPVHQ